MLLFMSLCQYLTLTLLGDISSPRLAIACMVVGLPVFRHDLRTGNEYLHCYYALFNITELFLEKKGFILTSMYLYLDFYYLEVAI